MYSCTWSRNNVSSLGSRFEHVRLNSYTTATIPLVGGTVNLMYSTTKIKPITILNKTNISQCFYQAVAPLSNGDGAYIADTFELW